MSKPGLPIQETRRKLSPIDWRLSLNRRFRCVPLNEFKAVAVVFCEEFAKQCNGSVFVKVKLYSDIPQFSTKLEHPDVRKERRERNEALVFKRPANIEDLDEESFRRADYV